MPRAKIFLPSVVWPVLLWLVFAGVYAGVFFMQREASIEAFRYTVSRIPSVMLYGSDMANTLETSGTQYGGFVGIAVGFAYAILAYVLLGIFSLVRLTKQKFGAMLAFLIAVLPIDAVAYFIRYQPRPRTAISSALANFVGMPLWYASLTLTAVIVLLFILSFFYGKNSSATEERL